MFQTYFIIFLFIQLSLQNSLFLCMIKDLKNTKICRTNIVCFVLTTHTHTSLTLIYNLSREFIKTNIDDRLSKIQINDQNLYRNLNLLSYQSMSSTHTCRQLSVASPFLSFLLTNMVYITQIF